MLDHLGETAAGQDLDDAVSAVLESGPPDTTFGWDEALDAALSAKAAAR
jgi:hypothetical protein